MIAVLAGGVGAARFLSGLLGAVDPAEVVAIVNVGDDVELHGLHISPDLDTVMYTLAGAINPDTGWGLRDETWHAMDTLAQYGGPAWFRLGDRDIGTHLYRTGRLRDGAPLSTITSELCAAWKLGCRVTPVTDDRVPTMVTIDDDGADMEVGFQDYFVGRQHDVTVRSLRFDGADAARPAPGVLDTLATASAIVIAPSNPLVSIAPVLAIPGVRDAVAARRDACVAVSPLVGGAALKGPADRLMREFGHDDSVVGVARLYADVADVLVIDDVDAALTDDVAGAGMRAVVTDTIMSSPEVSVALARTVLDAIH
jgi:LPPG:FO 2-phospho-L-lactate transferase